MNAREKLFELILPVFESIFGRFERGDLLFFGDRADLVSPAPRKYSLDAEQDMVYNIKSSSLNGIPFFADVTVSDGFINMTLSDGIVEMLADLYTAGIASPSVPDTFFTGTGEELTAMLIPLIRHGECDFPPGEPLVRRAFLSAMFSDTPESLSRAAVRIRRALELDRKERLSGKRLIPGKAALVMALALEKASTKKKNNDWS